MNNHIIDLVEVIGGIQKNHLQKYKYLSNNDKLSIFFVIFASKISIDMAGHSINRIRVALAEQNKTNRWLAEHVGKSEITVSRWVQNKAQPSLEQLLQVAKVLSVSPKDLINDINE